MFQVPLFTSGSLGLGLGLVSSGLGLVILVLVLRIWSCLHHCMWITMRLQELFRGMFTVGG